MILANLGLGFWIFTGYLFDRDILGRMINELPHTSEILGLVDVFMDGPYIEELKDLSAYFRGSSNQRCILVRETMANPNSELVLWEPDTPIYVFSNT